MRNFCAVLDAGAHRRSNSATPQHRSTWCTSCERDLRGRIKRNSSARRVFREVYPCPSTGSTEGACPGYVIDHLRALKHGGTDTPDNMQWQTREEAKAKDRVE